MPLKPNRSIIIIGAGPLMSRSLSLYLASHSWHITLISRSPTRLQTLVSEISVLYPSAPPPSYQVGDASSPRSLTAALNLACANLPNGKLDVLCYNAARVAPTPLMTLDPEVLMQDFGISAVGTLVAGKWFAGHMNTEWVGEGEWPLFLVPGGLLDKLPDVELASLSAVKSASQCVTKMFEMVLRQQNILVGAPLITGAVGTAEGGERLMPDAIVEGVFRPFFEGREKVKSVEDWVFERVW